MSRAARRVPANWKHPKDADGNFIPLLDGVELEGETRRWDEEASKWLEGLRRDLHDTNLWVPIEPEHRALTYIEWADVRPDPKRYMPAWAQSERTHWQMYEVVTEGTPISPVFAAAEKLARWLVVKKISAYLDTTATYAQWLSLIRQGEAETAVISAEGAVAGFVDRYREQH